MEKENSNLLWDSINELGKNLQKIYSVTGKEAILKQYLNQVKQYPLYLTWFKMISSKMPRDSELKILEYGSGPGLLTETVHENHMIKKYVVVEPEELFRDMTSKRVKKTTNFQIIDSIAEKFVSEEKFDFVIMTATYHHMYNKVKAIKNIHNNLKEGGKILMGEVFLPNYKYDQKYDPSNKLEFIESVVKYAAEQIRFMPNPKNEDVADQIKTATLDILRAEELKVPLNILFDQLNKVGFKNIKYILMRGKNKSINYDLLGWYFIEATK